MNVDDHPATPMTTEQQRVVKKCHGNRSLQRFKQRCRARGKNAKQVEQLVKKRSFIRRKQARLANITDNATVPTTNAVSSQNEEKERERKTMRPCFSVTFTWHRSLNRKPMIKSKATTKPRQRNAKEMPSPSMNRRRMEGNQQASGRLHNPCPRRGRIASKEKQIALM